MQSLPTRDRLVLTAERLFALHGLDAVSLRQISTEAGNANNSAVQYHFGDKDGLVQAIFEYRIPGLMHRRALLATEAESRGEPENLRRVLVSEWLPMLELAEQDGSYYLEFVARLSHVDAERHPFERLPESHKEYAATLWQKLYDLLDPLPGPVRSYRMSATSALCMQVASARERALRSGLPVVPYALNVELLLDAAIGLLTAPMSASAAAALEVVESSPDMPPWLAEFVERLP